jgi:threonine synthase
MRSPIRLVCRDTGESYDAMEPRWQSESGGLLDVEFDPALEIDEIASRPPSLWRYREALPLDDDVSPVSLGESVTPLVRITIGGIPVLVKQDHQFPTGSFKDRGAAVMVSRLHHLGVGHVVEDSSGNAGCAVAAYCARAGIACDIYVSRATSASKLIQLEYYGARIHRIDGTREDVARAARNAATNAYYASHVWDPFFLQGTKTFAYEVAEQLGWRAPDAVVLPVGNGTLVLGAFIGFQELKSMGLIKAMPQIIGVQASACAPLEHAWRTGAGSLPEVAGSSTLAEGIAVRCPARWQQILHAVRSTGGGILQVSEGAIRAALLELGRNGFFIEPTAAVAAAGTRELLRRPGDRESVVSVFTGSGLKAGHVLDEVLHS